MLAREMFAVYQIVSFGNVYKTSSCTAPLLLNATPG